MKTFRATYVVSSKNIMQIEEYIPNPESFHWGRWETIEGIFFDHNDVLERARCLGSEDGYVITMPKG